MNKNLSYEHSDFIFFATSRTMHSKLWFVNSPKLMKKILAFLARCQERHQVEIFAFILMGNHYHLVARFPKLNKAAFFKDFNSMISKLTQTHVCQFEGGKLFGRPPRYQALGDNTDVLDRFFYAALNPIAAGIVKRLSDYPLYNSFHDAVTNRKRKFKIFNREDYSNRKRYNKKIQPSDCMSEHTLTFTRLPGFENLSPSEYTRKMQEELQKRTELTIEKRLAEGKGFVTQEVLSRMLPGTVPQSTKQSTRFSKRPLILTSSAEIKERFLHWYFTLVEAYQEASRRFRAGDLSVRFPAGTYRPPSFAL